MNNIKNYRTEEHLELKKANNAWTECVSQKFLPKWLAGEGLNVEEVCAEQFETMKALDDGIYAESPMPFRSALWMNW